MRTSFIITLSLFTISFGAPTLTPVRVNLNRGVSLADESGNTYERRSPGSINFVQGISVLDEGTSVERRDGTTVDRLVERDLPHSDTDLGGLVDVHTDGVESVDVDHGLVDTSVTPPDTVRRDLPPTDIDLGLVDVHTDGVVSVDVDHDLVDTSVTLPDITRRDLPNTNTNVDHGLADIITQGIVYAEAANGAVSTKADVPGVTRRDLPNTNTNVDHGVANIITQGIVYAEAANGAVSTKADVPGVTRRDLPNTDTNVAGVAHIITQGIVYAEVANGAVSTKADVPGVTRRTSDINVVIDVVASIEAKLDPIIAELSLNTITYVRAKILIPELIQLILELKAELSQIHSFSPSSSDCRLLALRISALIGGVLKAVDNVLVVLRIDIAVLRPLLVDVGIAIQGVIDISVGVVGGLDLQLIAPLKVFVGILVKLGIQLVLLVSGFDLLTRCRCIYQIVLPGLYRVYQNVLTRVVLARVYI